jgi:hypothetical protein
MEHFVSKIDYDRKHFCCKFNGVDKRVSNRQVPNWSSADEGSIGDQGLQVREVIVGVMSPGDQLNGEWYYQRPRE